jgi:uncharacterized membrane protein
METKKRSVAKAVSWRVLASLTTFIISWAVTGSLVLGLGIASIEFWAKLFLYYGHERLWNAVDWGNK